ncbi:protein mono-ADP-ribosyltransferase PARP10 isoform X1 [Meriones unguiculatus]|uniref:protein mono-ADP-ribosyltransferase PARP10 isoform X1 n=2 Tax=Meriones unguiculatus TaxID=10047 RepID=UPI000B4F6BA7|nr:protein mono-ADP-ribosyltransferase PARP10 isoform X1 [Meriones unguiculatus]XP_060245214.1 protein mono-ADP-ribosyltransferase PARP10 isoform X1 [Meriones unguiculatus]
MAEEEEVGRALELRGLPPEVPDELLTLYFENHRRSGGGPLLSWQRFGCGGILVFQDPANARRVLIRAEHQLHGARLSLRPAPPRAPERVLLHRLPPDTSPQSLEQHVQALLCAAGHPVQACHALASPRQDCALVQLSMPLSEAEVSALEEQARNLPLNGTTVSLAWVPQTRAVRVVDGAAPVEPLLLELYLENERRSGGGPLEGLRSLPRQLGTVILFQQWQVAERVLKRKHWLQGSELSLVPHYDVLEPEELAEGISGGDHPTLQESGVIQHALTGARGLPGALPMTVGSGGTPGQLGTPLKAGPEGAPRQAMPIDSGSVRSLGQEEPINLGTTGSPEQAGFMNQGIMGSASPVGPVESFTELPGQVGPMISDTEGVQGQESLGEVGTSSPEQEGLLGLVGMAMESPEPGLESPGYGELQRQESLVEMVMSMDPGAMRFLQLYQEDLLASLEDVALFPLEGVDVTGFRLYGARTPCQAAQELLQSLLCSISCHVLSMKHPGSARFLLGVEGQRLLHRLEAQFQCVFGTERLASATLDIIDPERTDPTEALQVLHDHRTGSDQENMRLEEVQELLATLEGLPGEDRLSLEMGTERPGEQSEETTLQQEVENPTLEAWEEAVASNTGLEEEATLQLAIHRSLESQSQVADEREATALRQALALSLLEAEEPLGDDTGGKAQLVVHTSFEQDMDELNRALSCALEEHLQEETVNLQGCVLPTELGARLERCYDVSAILCGDRIVLRGFGVQPARAARHLAALLVGPWDQNLTFPLEASENNLSEQGLKEPLGRLEALEENSKEFQDVVQAFYDTLDAAHSRISIVRVERVSHPLLQQQYKLHRERLMQRCQQRPVEQVLYHGTSESAVPDICAHGFNRSFCGRNGTLYGQGVYFAKRASLSVLDRYSPPNAEGHKAVFVARVLTGDYGQGSQGLKAPPLRASGQVLRYDSTVDCLLQPKIFVIFHDTQALPTHLITCKNIPRGTPW